MAVKTKAKKASRSTGARAGQLDSIIRDLRGRPGALIPVLHRAQEIYGYLPRDVIETVSRGLRVPLSEVCGVISFYAFFTTEPKGRNELRVCLGTACFVKGADRLIDEIKRRTGVTEGGTTDDRRFSLEVCRCLGCCSIAPVVSVNGAIHRKITPKTLKRILDGCK